MYCPIVCTLQEMSFVAFLFPYLLCTNFIFVHLGYTGVYLHFFLPCSNSTLILIAIRSSLVMGKVLLSLRSCGFYRILVENMWYVHLDRVTNTHMHPKEIQTQTFLSLPLSLTARKSIYQCNLSLSSIQLKRITSSKTKPIQSPGLYLTTRPRSFLVLNLSYM